MLNELIVVHLITNARSRYNSVADHILQAHSRQLCSQPLKTMSVYNYCSTVILVLI